jgi:hypothetical protein
VKQFRNRNLGGAIFILITLRFANLLDAVVDLADDLTHVLEKSIINKGCGTPELRQLQLQSNQELRR